MVLLRHTPLSLALSLPCSRSFSTSIPKSAQAVNDMNGNSLAFYSFSFVYASYIDMKGFGVWFCFTKM